MFKKLITNVLLIGIIIFLYVSISITIFIKDHLENIKSTSSNEKQFSQYVKEKRIKETEEEESLKDLLKIREKYLNGD